MNYIPISFRVASLALGKSYDCPRASKVTLKDLGKKITSSHYHQVAAVDLLCDGVGEVCGGSLREDRLDILRKVMEESKIAGKYDW